MTIIARIGGLAVPAYGTPSTGVAEAHAWRVRPFPGTQGVLAGPSVTDAPMTPPSHVSASERCP